MQESSKFSGRSLSRMTFFGRARTPLQRANKKERHDSLWFSSHFLKSTSPPPTKIDSGRPQHPAPAIRHRRPLTACSFRRAVISDSGSGASGGGTMKCWPPAWSGRRPVRKCASRSVSSYWHSSSRRHSSEWPASLAHTHSRIVSVKWLSQKIGSYPKTCLKLLTDHI